MPDPGWTEASPSGQVGIPTQDFFIFYINLKNGTLPTTAKKLFN